MTDSDNERTITDNIWTDVTVRLIYVDRGNVLQKDIQVSKDEMETSQRDVIRQRFGDEVADDYRMSNSEFQGQLIRTVQSLMATPINAKSNVSNQMRFLPPSALREVTLIVNNIHEIIQA